MKLEHKTYPWDTSVDEGEFFNSDFVSWIDSINAGWNQRRRDYEPLNLYIKEAREWLDDETSINDSDDPEFKKDFIVREVKRIVRNSLYYLDRWHKMPDGDEEGGILDYKAHRAHEVICYLFDMKISCIFAKCRQIWFSSTFGGLITKRTCFFPNYSSIYMTDLGKKAEKTIKDKVYDPYTFLPKWLRPTGKLEKSTGAMVMGQRGGSKEDSVNSSVVPTAPTDYAATGFAPNCSFMDEIGLNKKFGEIIKEIEPSMYKYNHVTDELKRVRQMMAWGTGGNMDKGGTSMESVWGGAKTAWNEQNKSYALIPVLFDTFARPGFTQKMYDDLKRQAYDTVGPTREEMIAKFHMHYPLNDMDIFRRGKKTLVSSTAIKQAEDRIKSLPEEDIPQYGRMEPIYDISKPYAEDIARAFGVPYRIKGARFVPTMGVEDENTSVIILKHPSHILDPTDIWEYRYFQGTDPINSESGHSKMSSGVWDAYNCSTAACMFFRVQDYKEVFLQNMLLGLYYDLDIRNLVENNTGLNYMDFVDGLGMGRTLVGNMELDPKYHINSKARLGIPNRVGTNKYIIFDLERKISLYSHKINNPWFWNQLKSFVQKDLNNGTTRYQADDLRYHFDDAIFAEAFSFICAEAFERHQPKRKNHRANQKPTIKMVMSSETGWTARRAEVDMNGDVIRYLDSMGM